MHKQRRVSGCADRGCSAHRCSALLPEVRTFQPLPDQQPLAPPPVCLSAMTRSRSSSRAGILSPPMVVHELPINSPLSPIASPMVHSLDTPILLPVPPAATSNSGSARSSRRPSLLPPGFSSSAVSAEAGFSVVPAHPSHSDTEQGDEESKGLLQWPPNVPVRRLSRGDLEQHVTQQLAHHPLTISPDITRRTIMQRIQQLSVSSPAHGRHMRCVHANSPADCCRVSLLSCCSSLSSQLCRHVCASYARTFWHCLAGRFCA